MIAQTREFPTISTMTSMESTVVMAIEVDSDMMEECQWWNLRHKRKAGKMRNSLIMISHK